MTVAASTKVKATPLQQALRQGTSHLHRRLELQLGLLEPDLDLRRYRRVLELLYGFYAPLEALLRRRATMFSFPVRDRAVLLESDLVSLGLAPEEIAALPTCTGLPDLSTCEAVAGCTYVLEGASLGGQAVAPLLLRRLGLERTSGASFFIGDGTGTAARWAVVIAWLDGLHRTEVAALHIVEAAAATFAALVRWVDAREPSWSREAS